MRHVSEMTEHEMAQMVVAVQNAAIKFAASVGLSGLSHNGWFNFYRALEDAVRDEWKKARETRRAD